MDYKRTFYGKVMFKFTGFLARKLMRHMWLYYLLNYTWGLLMTIVGWIATGIARLVLGKKVIDKGRFGPCLYTMFGDNWGGLELGTNFFIAGNMGDEWTLHTKCHESGHTFQNAIFGPFALFLIFIPSFIRYWYQELRSRKGKENKPYDAIWFEGSATSIGEEYYGKLYK